MNGVRGAGVLLVALGVIYALAYSGRLRRMHTGASAGFSNHTASRQGTGRADELDMGIEPPRTMTMATAEGSYIGTTLVMSRHARVAAAGTGVRQPATIVIDETSVRWERAGAGEIRVAGTRLLGVTLERSVVGSVLRRPSIVMVSWHADNGDRYATGFLPRHHVETRDLVRAVETLMIRDQSRDQRDDQSDDQSHNQRHHRRRDQRPDHDDTTPDGPL